MSATETVLVTGPSGFVGTAVALECIRKGYKVKGTVRSNAKGEAFTKKYPSTKSEIEWVIVEDVAKAGALDTAVEGVDYVIHVASPFHFNVKDNEKDLLLPALEGTKNILRAAIKQPRVQHVVITSSMASVLDGSKGTREGYTYTEEDWNPATWDAAVKSDTPPFVYSASKKFAEKAAWDFLEEEKPHFSITTFCPPMIYGPPMQPVESMSKLNTSAAGIWALMNGSTKEVPPSRVPAFIDVRDVAKLHVAALSTPAAANQRYLAVGGHFSFSQIASIIAKAFPDEKARVTPSDNSPPPPHWGTDTSKAERDFGIEWISLEQCVTDTAKALYELEKELKD